MTATLTPWLTDEDCAIRAHGDFALLPPRSQCLARGTDGVFLSSDLWTLTSASSNFQAQGVAAGHVIQLTRTGTYAGIEMFAVVGPALAPTGVILRRIGLPQGAGLAASPPAGVTGVAFTVLTLDPQIALASFDVNQRIGIDDWVAGRRSIDLINAVEVKGFATLMTLWRAYEAAARNAGEASDHFAAQAKAYKLDCEEREAYTEVHWFPQGTLTGQTTMVDLNTRISRG